MVNVSAGQINPPSLMRKYCCQMHYALNLRSPISVFYVVPVWMFKLRLFPIEKSCVSCLLETLYRRHRGTPLRHLVKTYVCDDNPWESELIRTRCGHY